MINNEQHTPHVSTAHTASFQGRVQPWMMACFGTEISADGAERNHRFLEESLELVQACGCTASEAHQLVDYVFGRLVGERAQEVGGVMVTLAALCLAQDLDMHAAGETELARIWTKVEAIRAKQAAKPKHSPLPVAQHDDIDEAEMQPGGALHQPLLRIPMGGGNAIEWERRTSGRSGWLLRADDGQLIRALTVTEVELVDASIAAAQAGASSSDTCADMRALCSACGGTGDVHRIDGEWLGQCTCAHAWQLRAERAEADLAQVNEWRAAALAENIHSGERWAAQVAELEAQLAHRRAPLSPATRQAIAAARASGQSIAATPASMVFMNDGAEPGGGELDCPACGGSGHAADVPARSAP